MSPKEQERERNYQLRLAQYELEQQRQGSPQPYHAPFFPMWLLRPAVAILPLSLVGYAGQQIPTWRADAPSFFAKGTGAMLYTGGIYLFSIIVALIFYWLYFRKPRTQERVWAAGIILLGIGVLIESL